MTVVTRFAPSPTGFLHIGGARTALFNWLFARHHGGTYHLRVEDTDQKRSTQEAVDAIISGLNWLGLGPDGAVIYQSKNKERHYEVAHTLVKQGKAYYCYSTPEELAEMRALAKKEGKPMRYNGLWRNKPTSEAPKGIKPVIRIKMPQGEALTIDDLVQGEVTIAHQQLDDFVLLRSDGTPTYMLSVVVDDHDMGITHIIRGNDHLNNAFRQYYLYKAMGWDVPRFAHIPLIHGSDGAKLSKRHGALGVEAYQEMGYLPEAICNYLLRLGWSHGDDEIISQKEAISLFDFDGVGKSAANFDFKKLENLNAHYIRECDNQRLLNLIKPLLTTPVTDVTKKRLEQGIDALKQRATTLNNLAQSTQFYLEAPVLPLENPKAVKMVKVNAATLLETLSQELEMVQLWDMDTLHAVIERVAQMQDVGFGKIAQPARAALTGTPNAPDLTEVMRVLGKDETILRLKRLAQFVAS